MKARAKGRKARALADAPPAPEPRAEGARAPAGAAPEGEGEGEGEGPSPPPLAIAYAPEVVRPLRAKPPPRDEPKAAKKPARHGGLTEFQRTAFRLFGPFIVRRPASPKLAESLAQSRSGLRAEALQSTAMLSGLIGAATTGAMGFFFAFILLPLAGFELAPALLLLVLTAPLLVGFAGYMAVVASPSARASARAKDIDLRLPYALNYIAAMASAGVNVDTIFKSLGEQRIYGEVAREAEAIYRDIALFGKDTVTAFKRAIARTPSDRLAELLQGAITTFGSGGDLQGYFSSKAQRYMSENRQVQKQYVETMGLMAETYVTTAVAGPLFLIVMMAIMGMLGGEGPSQLGMVVYIMLPLANFGFVFGLQSMTPKM